MAQLIWTYFATQEQKHFPILQIKGFSIDD